MTEDIDYIFNPRIQDRGKIAGMLQKAINTVPKKSELDPYVGK